MEYNRCFEQIRDTVKLTRSHHDMLVHANYHVGGITHRSMVRQAAELPKSTHSKLSSPS
jgi:hypothetical protein